MTTVISFAFTGEMQVLLIRTAFKAFESIRSKAALHLLRLLRKGVILGSSTTPKSLIVLQIQTFASRNRFQLFWYVVIYNFMANPSLNLFWFLQSNLQLDFICLQRCTQFNFGLHHRELPYFVFQLLTKKFVHLSVENYTGVEPLTFQFLVLNKALKWNFQEQMCMLTSTWCRLRLQAWCENFYRLHFVLPRWVTSAMIFIADFS